MKEFFEKISKKIRTKEDLVFYLEQIAKAIELTSREPEKKLSEKLEGKIDQNLEEILLKFSEQKDTADIQEIIFFLELLRNYLISIPQVKLNIALFPEEELLAKILNWFENNLGKKVILDIVVNPRIVAGAIIEYQGRISDFSLAKNIKEIVAYYGAPGF